MSAGAGGRATERVAVVGLGLIGGSLARLLTARGVDVVATDVSPSARGAAARAGLAVADDVAGCVAGASLVVLAVPLAVMPVVAEHVAITAHADATVTDVGSVKGPVRAAMEAAGLAGRYVGAHPMSGTERSGFSASEVGLLDGVPWAVTVAPGVTEPRRLHQVLTLVTGACSGTAAVLTDDVHDEAAALVSHVPHVLATQLLNAVAGAPVRAVATRLAAGSFRDGTRVAFTDPARTEAMVVQNASWVVPALRKVVRDLELVVADLESNASPHGFFHAADGMRAEGPTGGPGSRSGEVEVVALEGDWPATLVQRCTAGDVVVRVRGAHADVERP